MRAPLTWLKDYVKIDVDVHALADKLMHAGFEVEEIDYLGEGIENVVVGKIVKTEKHPNADKLTICQISVSEDGSTLQIVTGASNIKTGDYVPVALDGAHLPTGQEIKNGELRGVESCGMLCSGGELKLTEADFPGAEAHGILILDPKGLKLGQDIKAALGLDEYVLDISVTANRPDCQSILGIAREIGAVLGKKVKEPSLEYTADTKDKITNHVSVEVQAPDLCPRYLAKCVKDVKLGPSPKFIRDRLRWAGLRPINNIVDITNFVLLELGQPMHAFDLSRIQGKKIVVRRAAEGETIITLDGKKSVLDSEALVISDGVKPVALAGIMGGENSGISPETKEIVFECAKFNRQNIRRVSRRLGVRSDSSAMYERGVNAYTSAMASERSLALIFGMKCGTIVGGGYDFNAEKKDGSVLKAAAAEIEGVLGISIPEKTMVKLLSGLGIETECENGVLKCKIPPYREDLETYADLAEELIRLYGYDNIEGTLLPGARIMRGGESPAQKSVARLESALIGSGYSEIITYSFIGEKGYDYLNLPADDERRKSIRLMHPLGEEISLMRTTLSYSMLNTVANNLARKNVSGRFYEYAMTYRAKALPLTELPEEYPTLVLGNWGDDEDFFTMKGSVEQVLAGFGVKMDLIAGNEPYLHPGRSADVYFEGKRLGSFGEVHPSVLKKMGMEKRVYLAELDLTGLIGREAPFRYRDIPKFQDTARDIAVIVDEEVSCARLMKVIRANASELNESVELFDVYKGSQVEAGKKSLAFNLRFRAADRTLKDEEIDEVMTAVIRALEKECKAQLRK